MSNLERLEADIDHALTKRSFRNEKSRGVPFFWASEFSWTVGTDTVTTERVGTLINAAPGELRLYRMWYNVALSSDASYVLPYPFGVCTSTSTTTANAQVFDFEWQAELLSSNRRFGTPGHNAVSPFMSRTVLETYHMQKRWSFPPLRLGLNESVRLTVRPTALFAYTGTPTFVMRIGFEGVRAYNA